MDDRRTEETMSQGDQKMNNQEAKEMKGPSPRLPVSPSPPRGDGMGRVRFHWLALGVMVVLALGIYANAMHAPFQFDDADSIDKVRTFDHIGRLLKQPTLYKHRIVPYLTLAVDYRLWGHRTFGYHLFNVIVHVLNGFLVYLITLRLFDCGLRIADCGLKNRQPEIGEAAAPGGLGRGQSEIRDPRSEIDDTPAQSDFFSPKALRDGSSRQMLALMIALLFLTHPLQTNAVTYIVERIVLLVTFFYFLAFYAFIRAYPPGEKIGRMPKALWLLGSFGAFFLALWSKEIAATLPAVVLLYVLLFVVEDRRRFLLKGALVLFPAALVVGVIGVSYLHQHIPLLPRWSEPVGGFYWGVKQNIYTQINVIVGYIKLLVFPLPRFMNIDRDVPLVETFWGGPTVLSALILTGVFLSTLWLAGRSKVIAFGIGWFFIALIPSSSVWPIWDLMVEYRTYLPGFGFHLVFGSLVYLVAHAVAARKGIRRAWIWAPFGVLLILYAAGTIQRNRAFNDVYGLWKDAALKSPNKWRPHNNLADAYEQVGNYEEARKEYRTVLKLDPGRMRAYYGLGNVYHEMGRPEEAIAAYQRAIAVDSTFALSHNNLGIVYDELGRSDLAEEEYGKALRLKPDFVKPYNNLAILYAQRGELERAKETIARAIRLDPKYAIGHHTLGKIYALQGKWEQAGLAFERAVHEKPDFLEAWCDLGDVYNTQENYGKAEEAYQKALRVAPRSSRAHRALGMLYLHFLKAPEKALHHLRKALALDPEGFDAEAMRRLVRALEKKMGRETSSGPNG